MMRAIIRFKKLLGRAGRNATVTMQAELPSSTTTLLTTAFQTSTTPKSFLHTERQTSSSSSSSIISTFPKAMMPFTIQHSKLSFEAFKGTPITIGGSIGTDDPKTNSDNPENQIKQISQPQTGTGTQEKQHSEHTQTKAEKDAKTKAETETEAHKQSKQQQDHQNTQNDKKPKSTARKLAKTVGIGVAAATAIDLITFIMHQQNQKIAGEGEIFDHLRQQHKKHWFRQMHEPFITHNKELLDLFYTNFPELAHLMPKDVASLTKQMAVKTPIKLKPLVQSPTPYNPTDSHIIAAGGPPALIGLALLTMLAKKRGIELNSAYINDYDQAAIWLRSAFHVENDADGEAPTGTSPKQFLETELCRALCNRVSYEKIQRTGEYPWRSVDWIGILKNPSQWLAAINVALQFQLEKAEGTARQKQLTEIAEECRNNEKLYDELNEALGGKLLLPGKGGMIAAQTPAQVKALDAQKKSLAAENRELRSLSTEQVQSKYPVTGIAFAEKTHDRTLNPYAFELLKQYIRDNGGKVINGVVKNNYADENSPAAVLHYQTPEGEQRYLSSHLQMTSFGRQPVIGFNNKSVNDNVSATGTSGIAAIFTKPGTELPRVIVPRAGESDHWPLISIKPRLVTYKGKECEMHIVRFTSSATIGPLDRGEESAWYDGTCALGSLTALHNIYKDPRVNGIETLTIVAGNRVVSKNMQTKITQVSPGIHDQNGGGGGAITRAPKFITYLQQLGQIDNVLNKGAKNKTAADNTLNGSQRHHS